MEDISNWLGPAMSELAAKQRAFVRAMYEKPLASRREWAKMAGYSDVADGAKVRAHTAYHNPKVQAAIVEYGKTLFGTEGVVLAVNGLLALARQPNHPYHVKALELIANRTGFNEKQQIEVTHRDLTGDALQERVRLLEAKYGLGPVKVIEHKAEEAK